MLLYGLASAVLATTALAPGLHLYLRIAVALVLSLGVVAAVDVILRLIRGDQPPSGQTAAFIQYEGWSC